MRVERARPPNWDAIVAVFPHVRTWPGVLYAWGDTVFNPDGVAISASVMAHEEEHGIRQAKLGSVEVWWDRYLKDEAFRFSEELFAHIVEYTKTYESSRHRNERRFYLDQIAERLAGPLYGRLVTIEKAKRLLKIGARELLTPQPEKDAA